MPGNKPEIKNVSDFLNRIKKLITKDNLEDKTIFFRGHWSCKWKSIPGIGRDKTLGLLKNEHLIFRDFLARYDNEFQSCHSAFDTLTKMQHYELPTRLLDVTTNALVALYFACREQSDQNDSEDAEVLVYAVPADAIKYFDSDTVTAVANIAKCNFEEICLSGLSDKYFLGKDFDSPKDKLLFTMLELSSLLKKGGQELQMLEKCLEDLKDSEEVKGKAVKILKKLRGWLSTNNSKALLSTLEGELNKKKGPSLSEYLSKINNDKDFTDLENYKDYQSRFNEIEDISYLLHQIRADKSYFNPFIVASDLGRVWAVRAKKNNPRIMAQSGDFFLFGLGVDDDRKEEGLILTKKRVADLPKDWVIAGKGGKTQLIIKATYKDEILKELEQLGMKESTLLPEMTVYAKELKNKYGVK